MLSQFRSHLSHTDTAHGIPRSFGFGYISLLTIAILFPDDLLRASRAYHLCILLSTLQTLRFDMFLTLHKVHVLDTEMNVPSFPSPPLPSSSLPS